MKKDFLKDEANAVRVQKHQLNNAENKLSEIDEFLSTVQNEQNDNNKVLDGLLQDMESLLSENQVQMNSKNIELNSELIEQELEIEKENLKVSFISKIDKLEFDENISWEDYIKSINSYAIKHNINLTEDPFKHLMTKSQQVELQKRIQEEFTLKNANCDKYDYMIAGTCGVIGGLIDILFVGAPGDSNLGNIVDKQANKITEKFAELLGWDKKKAIEKGRNTTASAVAFLEKKFKVNYDQATTHATNGAVKNLYMSNHHLKNLAHSPDIIGLFFSILNQFTNTSTFISNGKIITIDTETFELQGGNFIAKIFCGFVNWFGHLMSDWTGSSGTIGQGRRGTGIPIPFYNLFQLMNFGHFGKKERQTFAMITSEVFEKGYDFRHGITMAIPVVITEILIRFMYTMKAHFYHNKSWEESIPNANVPELRRMLLVGHGTLCLIDGIDAYAHSGGGQNIVELLSRLNLIGWVRFGYLALKELNAWYNSGNINVKVDKYLDEEYRKMIKNFK
jgi:hypothetical protein